jgi:hypothetical protein
MTAWVKRETFTVSANVRFAPVATELPHYRERRFGPMALKKQVLRLALCCLSSFDPAQTGRLLGFAAV